MFSILIHHLLFLLYGSQKVIECMARLDKFQLVGPGWVLCLFVLLQHNYCLYIPKEIYQIAQVRINSIESSLYTMHIFYFQVIELDLETLPDGDEVLTILRQEACPLNVWVTLAVRNDIVVICMSSMFKNILCIHKINWGKHHAYKVHVHSFLRHFEQKFTSCKSITTILFSLFQQFSDLNTSLSSFLIY